MQSGCQRTGALGRITVIFLIGVLTGCGGGGGGSGAAPTPPPPAQQLQLSASQIGFSSPSMGGVPTSAQVSGTVSGNPAAVYAKVLYTTNGIATVSTPQVSGTTATAAVMAKPGFSLAPGTYQDTITVQACPDPACATQFAGSPATIKVAYIVGLDVEPQSISVQIVEGAAIPAQTLNATYYAGSGTLSLSAQYASGGGWLTVPTSSVPLPASFPVTLGSPPPGSYQATLTLTANGAATEKRSVPVTYTIESLLQVGKIADFSVTDQTHATGQTRSVAVTSADSTRNTSWTATVDAASPWLQVTGGTGTTGGNSTLQLSLVPTEVAKLRNAHYTAQVSIVPSLAGASTVVVPVGLALDRTEVGTVAPYVEPSAQPGQVILRGAHFDTVAIQGVQFGAQTVSSFQVDSPTQIRVTHPSLAAGQYPVTILVGGSPSDSSAVLVVQDATSYSAAGVGTVPIQYAQYAEFDAERHSCYAASTTSVAGLRAGASSWTATTSPVQFTSIFGIALTADGRQLLVGDRNQIVHLDPATLNETYRTTLTAPTSPTSGLASLVRVDDGTVAFVAQSNVWAYHPWSHVDSALISGTSAVDLQSNRIGNALVLNLTFGSTNFSIVDAMSLAQSFTFASPNFATFYAFATDRFGSRWVFTPISSGLPTTVTDGTGKNLGQVPPSDAVGNALSDDGQTLIIPDFLPPETYQSYDLSPLASGGSVRLRGTAPGKFGANDRLSVITPQQNEVVTCGLSNASAVVIP